jgi:hypothetical protein
LNDHRHRQGLGLLAAAVLTATAGPAWAVGFSHGEWVGNWDTTISYGAAWRVGGYDDENVGKAVFNPTAFTLTNQGQQDAIGRWSVNSDDGNLNYPDGGDLISNAVKITTELDVSFRNYGAFIRATAFYDFENEGKDFLSDRAQELVGSDIRLLDAYVWGEHVWGEKGFNWRLGYQVVSWGESTFIQGGLNSINPVDVSKLRVAGAELKEAFIGIPLVWSSLNITDSVSIEPLYIFKWKKTDPDPAGAYFATNDIATPGASYAMLNFGTLPQPVTNPDLYEEVCLHQNYAASDSNLPPQLVAAGCSGSFPRADSVDPKDGGQFGVALRWYAEQLNGTEFGFYYLNYHSKLPLISGRSITTTAPSSGRYWTEYPEDIHLYGVSFNTSLDTWSLGGEVSYRPNAPLQFDDVEVLFAGLSPLNPLIPAPAQRFYSQLGDFGPGEYIKGWDRYHMWQAQLTTTKVWGPENWFKAGQVAFAFEVGMNSVPNLPSKETLRFNGDGTDTGGGPDFQDGYFRNPLTQIGGFADDFSWGYRMAVRADYFNVFGSSVTISPSIGWAQDISGTTPGPGGAFIDGRKQVTLGLAFLYLQEWAFDLSYTSYFGAGSFNLLEDRDFVGASVRYSF